MIIRCFIVLVFSIYSISSIAQDEGGFLFHRPNKKSYRIGFVNYNNLIIIKVKLNNQPMNFLLDTGVDKTILFGLEGADIEDIKQNSKKILIRGVSGKKKTYAYKNSNNLLEIGKLKDKSHDVYAIFDDDFNISNKIGYQVQGIIGYEFFKNLVVNINYGNKVLKVYNPKFYNKDLKSYQEKDMRLYKGKPYLKTEVKQNDQFKQYIFLLDTGSGDALWVKLQADTKIPDNNFRDILGYGFADIISGVRSKASAFKLGSYKLESPKIAYPDTLSYLGLKFTTKSGVIGSEIMRRFNWVLDYQNNKAYFKKNNNFSDKFNYDMSGLLLIYDGYQIITRYANVFKGVKIKTDSSEGYNKVERQPDFFIEKKPILKVGAVRPNSSAYDAGFIEGDIIVSVNNKPSYRYDLQQLTSLFSSEEGKTINFEISRFGRLYEKQITLKSRFLE